ncbi:serine hydrolase family protein [Helicobacter saguini]|uniref:Serine hydrolase family protein n=1 Tax=Helicobacter saguini TaxID=1548018 RepID=A0A347VRN3_9HELI|nr:alpha/beta hydrolase [Helicobacter saguini]MWV62840.1 serine hydrolase family protein [Helicobacter saguini]MWV66491.1 serine hydrolase family protein [Helicobacter saguini]MWV68840.1 serine hydrolase family protein [Helicobacter saguini]MWV71605.1 serine hydrolase family protein [Helicobacter saguini]TLD94409.1 serine hydrolase family protein [Helicobacter saguini]
MALDSKNRVYIIHGYDSGVDKNWFPWLKNELGKMGVESHILPLPNPTQPKPQEWLDSMISQVLNIGGVDINTYFVGHSLGTISTLHFLQSLQNLDSKNHNLESNKVIESKIGGYILVSGFCSRVKGLEMLNNFIDFGFDFTRLRDICSKKLVISARDDSIVPTKFSYELAGNLDSDFIQTRSGGHFMQSEGYTKFPLVLEQLKRFFSNLY